MPKTVHIKRGMLNFTIQIPTSTHDYSFCREVAAEHVEKQPIPPPAGNLTAEERRLLAAGRLTWDTRKPFEPRQAPRRKRRD